MGQGKLAFGIGCECLSVIVIVQTLSVSCHNYRLCYIYYYICVEIIVGGYVLLLWEIMYIFLKFTLYSATLHCQPRHNELNRVKNKVCQEVDEDADH